MFVSFEGFVTDGEFNSLRTQGSQRPVSVIQLIMDAKSEARAIPSKDIEKFFKTVNKGTDSVFNFEIQLFVILNNYLLNLI